MKRLGDELIEEICEYNNIHESIHTVLKGTKRKKTRIGKLILKYEPQFIRSVAKRIRSGKFHVGRYQEMLVTDGPKIRRVQSIPILDRIAANAVMSVVEAHVFRKYIRTTGASIKQRGAHDLKQIIERDMRRNPGAFRYCYSSDFKKFYESIQQDFLLYSLRKMFKGRILMGIFESFVGMMPNGISIGLRSSQGFGNMMLSLHLDHYVKDRLGWKFYYRYCDDIHAACEDKSKMWKFRNIMHERADFMHLTIKPDEHVYPITEGIDALGYRMYPEVTRLRKRVKKNFAKRYKKLSSKRRRRELVASFYGHCKHASCNNLFYKLTGVRMKDFKELKIKPKYGDNKKRFNGQRVSLKTLRNTQVVVLDFETGVVPGWMRDEYNKAVAEAKSRLNTLHQKYGDNIPSTEEYVLPENVAKPEGRYVVFIEDEEGKKCKFFTGDRDIWSVLDQVREADELPFRTTIKAQDNGNNQKFYFA